MLAEVGLQWCVVVQLHPYPISTIRYYGSLNPNASRFQNPASRPVRGFLMNQANRSQCLVDRSDDMYRGMFHVEQFLWAGECSVLGFDFDQVMDESPRHE